MQKMTLHWGDTPILLESHPGPSSGAIWVIMPEEKVVFVGDAVTKSQPPFLAYASLPEWIEALKLLQEPEYKGFTIISGRGGAVTTQVVRSQADTLKRIYDKVDKLGNKKASPAIIDKLADQLLKDFKAPAARQKQYAHRLRYGLNNYYARHYHSTSRHLLDEQ
jgi:glyoxylase-like metal-dependent hydrolase (beta-lactamase superfamily II)